MVREEEEKRMRQGRDTAGRRKEKGRWAKIWKKSEGNLEKRAN